MASRQINEDKPLTGFLGILIQAGFSAIVASLIVGSIQEDEKIIQLLQEDKTPLIFMTQQDAKVDDKICLPLEGTVWDRGDKNRPRIPLSLHPNCRCFWIDAITGDNLGQF